MPVSKIRVIDVETGGNGPNDVCEIGWQDIVLDEDGRWRVNEDRGAVLVNPGRPMFRPHTIEINGLDLWRYLGGPWQHESSAMFCQAD